jgi:hypothetical protein
MLSGLTYDFQYYMSVSRKCVPDFCGRVERIGKILFKFVVRGDGVIDLLDRRLNNCLEAKERREATCTAKTFCSNPPIVGCVETQWANGF